MRVFIVTGMVCVLVCAAIPMVAPAVGTYTPGREDCDKTSLTARGLIPDTLNKFSEVFAFHRVLAKAIDTVAGEVKAILSQFGIETPSRTEPEVAERTTSPKEKKVRKIKVPPVRK